MAQLARTGWGAEDCCRIAIAKLRKARSELCKTLVETPISDTADPGEDTPARQLWRAITILQVAIDDLDKDDTAERLARKTRALANRLIRQEKSNPIPSVVSEVEAAHVNA